MPGAGETDDGDLAAEGGERVSAPAVWPWPADAPAEAGALSDPVAAVEIEAASLPTLAGEALPSQSSASASAAENPPQTILDAGDAEHGPLEHGPLEGPGSPSLAGGREPATAGGDDDDPRLAPLPEAAAEPRAVDAEERGHEEHGHEERGHEERGHEERGHEERGHEEHGQEEQEERGHERGHGLAAMPTGPDIPAAPEPQPEPAPAVETVTEQPPSPRKGWWQRLIQS
ncbi:MAG: hypothetical protein ACREE1_00210 [Stellaceae bacterium]